MRQALRRSGWALIAALAGCERPRTELVVRVDSDLAWGPGRRIQSVALTVRRGGATGPLRDARVTVLGDGANQRPLPLSVGVVATDGDTDTPVWIEALGCRDPGGCGPADAEVAQRALVRFAPGETWEVPLSLSAACVTASCASDQRCTTGGRCESATAAQATLRPHTGIRGPADAAVAMDVLGDATTDATIDASIDVPTAVDSGVDVGVDVGADLDRPAPLDAGHDVPPTTDRPVVDVAPDVPVDVPPVVPPPRPIAPLSTATVTSRRPELRWSPAPGTDSTRVQLCLDRACSREITTFEATGDRGAPAADLPRGVVYWRLYGRAGARLGTAAGPTWQFTVGPRSATGANTSWGSTLDLNGDGYVDLAVAAQALAGYTGRLYIYPGGAAGVATTPAVTLTGPDGPGGHFGETGYAGTVEAGDVNGDGFADLMVAATHAVGNTGRLYVYPGGREGVATSPATTINGPVFDSYFGNTKAAAGDVNGDGYGDVIVGLSEADSQAGRAYLYFGSSVGPSTTSSLALRRPTSSHFRFGISVAGVGDVNGDGLNDVAVGAYAPEATTPGRVYVYFGGAGSVTTDPSLILEGPSGVRDGFGSFVAGAGDVDGDGFSDIIASASETNRGEGTVYLYRGRAGALATTPAVTIAGTGGMNTLFGHTCVSAGDVNGDGYADAMVSTFTAPRHVYLFVGSGGGLMATPAVTLDAGWAIHGSGDVNGDGWSDLISGDSQSNRAFVYYGAAAGPLATPSVTLVGPDGTTGQFGGSVTWALPPVRVFPWGGVFAIPHREGPLAVERAAPSVRLL